MTCLTASLILPPQVPIHDPAEIDEIFDAISYSKGLRCSFQVYLSLCVCICCVCVFICVARTLYRFPRPLLI
jgi:hypothetical protein